CTRMIFWLGKLHPKGKLNYPAKKNYYAPFLVKKPAMFWILPCDYLPVWKGLWWEQKRLLAKITVRLQIVPWNLNKLKRQKKRGKPNCAGCAVKPKRGLKFY